MSLKEKIIVPLLVVAITGFILYGTFNFFGEEKTTELNSSEISELNTELAGSATLKDGVYEGTAMGYAGPVTTRITILKGKIVKAEVINHSETPEYFSFAEKILGSIVSANTYDVDNIAGCTVTCNAIKDGVHKAMLKALGKASEADKIVDKNKKPVENGQIINVSSVPNKDIKLPSKLKDGIYYGSGYGYRGEIRVAVTIKGGRIYDINVLSHIEDISYYNKAVTIIDRLKNGASSVDTVAGATVSSKGIIQAVNDALSKAGVKDTIVSAGKTPGKEVKPLPDVPDVPVVPEGMKLKDGTYFASANGYAVLIGKDDNQKDFPPEDKIPVKVKVTIKNGKVSDIDVVEHKETPEYFEEAKRVISDFLKGKDHVDNVTGATFTSVALKTAIVEAIKQAGYVEEVADSYTDGIWYGQAYGFHSSEKWYGTREDENRNTQTNVKVTIRNGKIKDIQLVRFGDDPYYHESFLDRNNAYEKINKEIIKTNGVESAVEKFVLNKTSSTGEDTDAISGATFSGNGYINAVKDALDRSLNATLNHKHQYIKSLAILPHLDNGHAMNLPYGKPFNVGNFRILLGYADDNNSEAKTKIITLKEAVDLGVQVDLTEFPGINKDMVFTPVPEDTSDYTKSNVYDLIIRDPVSGSKSMYKGITGSRHSTLINLKEIIITGPDNQKITVPWNNNGPGQTIKAPFRPEDVKDVKVVNENNEIAPLKNDLSSKDDIARNGFGVRPNQPNILKVEVATPKVAKDSPVSYNYEYKSLQLTFDISFSPDSVTSIKVADMPSKVNYTVGDVLSLDGLKVQFVDNLGIAGEVIEYKDFEAKGITVKGTDHGDILSTQGEQTITIESVQNGKTVTGTFKITVNKSVPPEERIETGIRFYDLRTGSPVVISEAVIPAGTNNIPMEIPEDLYNLKGGLANPVNFKWTITDQFGKDFDMMPEMPFAYMSGTMMLYNANGSATKFVKLSIAKPVVREAKKVRFYEIKEGEKVLIAETDIPSDGERASIVLDKKYLDMGNGIADRSKFLWVIADQNGKDFDPKPEYEGPSFSRAKNTMIIYRDGSTESTFVNLEVK